MIIVPRYKENALECIELARRTVDLQTKRVLLAMAQAWVRLSEYADATDGRSGSLGPSGETQTAHGSAHEAGRAAASQR